MGLYNLEFGKNEFEQGVGNSPYEGGVGSDGICNLDFKKGLLAPPIRLRDADKKTTVQNASYTWTGNVVSVTLANHGFKEGQIVYIDFTSGQGTPDGRYTLLASPGTNDFTFTLTGSGTGGNCTVNDLIPGSRIIAYANDSAQTTPGAMCVSEYKANADGQIFKLDSASSIDGLVATDVTRNYKLGYTDAIFFDNTYWVTSTTDIVNCNASLGTFDFSWWVTTKSKTALIATVPHQMAELKGYLYVLDGNTVHRIDDAGTIVEDILTLGVDFVCMAIENHNNKLYIYADKIKSNLLDPDSTGDTLVSSPGELIIWDGTNIDTSTIERYRVSSPIYTMKSFNGTLYIWDAYNFGYWNGMEMVSLRETNGYPKYKCMITTYKNRLYWIEGSAGDVYGTTNKRIICFNGKQFYHCMSTSALTGATIIDSIFRWYGDALVVNTNSAIYACGLNPAIGQLGSNSTYIAYSKWFELPVISKIEKCLLELSDVTATNNDLTISAVNAKGEEKTLMTLTYSADGAVYSKEKNSLTDNFSSFRLKLTFTNFGSSAIRRILLTLNSTANPL